MTRTIMLGVLGGFLLVPSLGTDLTQSKVTAGVSFAAGMVDTNQVIFFRATVSDSGAENCRLDVEVQPLGVAFTNVPNASSGLVASGSVAETSITVTSALPSQSYHWQGRSRNASGVSTAFVSFGGNAESEDDFTVDLTPPEPTLLTQDMQTFGGGSGPDPVGSMDTNSEVELTADHDDPDGQIATLEFEVQHVGDVFTGTFTADFVGVGSGGTAIVTVNGSAGNPFLEGGHHWQVRAVNALGYASDWVSFGANSELEADFVEDCISPSQLKQYVIPFGAISPVGSIDTNGEVVLEALVDDPESGNFDFDFEVQPVGQPFTGIPQFTNNFGSSGNPVTVSISSGGSFTFVEGAYHWQVRARRTFGGGVEYVSDWISFGGNPETEADFIEETNNPSQLKQYVIPFGASSPAGSIDTNGEVVLEVLVNDTESGNYAFDFEVQPVGQPFTGVPQFTNNFGSSGNPITVTVGNFGSFSFAEGAYHWQVRARRAFSGGVEYFSDWISFGGNAETEADFIEETNNPSQLKQYVIPFGASSPAGSIDTNGEVVLEVLVNDTESGNYAFDFEVQPVGQPFTGVPQFTNNFGSSGNPITVTVGNFGSFSFAEGAYHWQVRARRAFSGGVEYLSDWISFGGNAETEADFIEETNNPSQLKQYVIPLGASSPAGSIDTNGEVVLEVLVNDTESGNYAFDFEVQPVGQPFTGVPQFTNNFGSSGNPITVTVGNFGSFSFAEGAYHWQVRARRAFSGGVEYFSDWVSFGGNPETAADFVEACGPITLIQQSLTVGGAAAPVGSVDPDGTLELRAVVTDPEAEPFSIQVEVLPVGIPFSGVPTASSGSSSSGSPASVSVSGLAADGYHWQVRAINDEGYVGAWIPFGANPENSPDFIVGGTPLDPTGLEQSDDPASPAQPPVYADNDGTLEFRGTIALPSGIGTASLQIEVQPVGSAFSGTPQATSAAVANGAVATISFAPPIAGASRWRARAFSSGGASAWVEFGGNPAADADFVVDLTTPSSAITTSGFRNATTYPGMIQGTASDIGSGVALVQVSIQRVSDLLFFDGAAFTSAIEIFLAGTGTTNWVFPFGATDGDSYNLRARATDAAGNTQAVPSTASFTFDITSPTSTPDQSGLVTAAAYSGSVTGTAADTVSGIASVAVSIRWINANLFWDGTTFGVPQVFVMATGTTTWSLPFAPADNQSYEIISRATDGAGNVETPGGTTTFTFESSGPDSTVLTTGSFSVGSFPGAIAGTASTAAGATLTVVEITLQRASDSLFYDGAAFTSATPVFLAATGTTSWSFAVTLIEDTYFVESRATDDVPEVETSLGTSTFVIATSLPVTTITTSGLFTVATYSGSIQGTAAGGTGGITLVEISVTRDSDGLSWDGAAFTSATQLFLAATGTATWTLPVTATVGESYTVRARATDGALVIESPPAVGFFALVADAGTGTVTVNVESARSRARCALAAGQTASPWLFAFVVALALLLGLRRS